MDFEAADVYGGVVDRNTEGKIFLQKG